jgi:hypothetical protein
MSSTETISTSRSMAPAHIKAVDEDFSFVFPSSGQGPESSGGTLKPSDRRNLNLPSDWASSWVLSWTLVWLLRAEVGVEVEVEVVGLPCAKTEILP